MLITGGSVAGDPMGVWGTGIFSEDIACDIREAYRELVGEGLTGQQATDALLEEWREDLDDY